MAAYRYRPPRRHLRHYRRNPTPPAAKAALAFGAAVVLAAGGHAAAHAGTHHHQPHVVAGPARAAAAVEAIGYARGRLGLPYCWGGTGPSCYDCSGLVMQAWAAAGVAIPRTSQAQWAALRHVTHPRPGDLVLAPGSDGSWAAPGHVGLVIGRGRVIQAYATGYPIDVTSLASFAAGAGGIVGYARPGGA